MGTISDLEKVYIEQLKKIADTFYNLEKRPGHLSDQKPEEISKLIVRIRGAVERITGIESPYARQVIYYFETYRYDASSPLSYMIGVLQGLVSDIENGYLKSTSELIHADVFTDYLSMADHLLGEGYKDAAAVLTGGTLEAHLKQLCAKHGIVPDFTDNKGNIRNKKAEALNSELAKANAYSKQDQKNVTAWLGLRNDAAHANYNSYTDQQVRLVTAAIRDFITRVPA